MKTSFTTQAGRLLLGVIFLCSTGLLSAQQWNQVPGISARDIAVGKNGVAWAIGTNNAIYWWNNVSWVTVPGGASRITVDPDGSAWVVNDGGQIFKYNFNNKNWDLKPGLAKDIAVGANGAVWIIGANEIGGGYGIYKWNGSSWTNIPGGATRITVDPSGNAWIVNNSNNIFYYTGSYFEVKPGTAKDIGVGANGAVWCTGADGNIYQWDGSNWKLQTGTASEVSVAPDGNAWVVKTNGEVWRSINAPLAFYQFRTLFPRGQTYEHKILKALNMYPYATTMSLGGVEPLYANIDPLGQAFGNLGLLATEIYYGQFQNVTAEKALTEIKNDLQTRQKVSGILAGLVIEKVSTNATDLPTISLKKWATDLYRSVKIRCAKGLLDEYQKWKTDPCSYKADGYKAPPDCALKGINIAQLLGAKSPPEDILGKAGLKSVLGNNADAITSGVSLGLTTAVLTGSAIALTTSLGTSVAVTGGGGAAAALGYGATMVTLTETSLFTAFGGSAINSSISASGAIGGGWAGVVAAPIAVAVLVVVVGTMEGFRVAEAVKLEPMLKMKLGAAITDPINIINVMADKNSMSLFFIAFQEAAMNNFRIPEPIVNGEVRFYCQAGFVSSFRLSYTANGQNQTFTTPDLPVGHEQSYTIPYNATNIKVEGWYLSGTWKLFISETLAKPTYICYTSYGTIFVPRFKKDCPEVGGMTTKEYQLTVTQGGGYSAWIRLTYVQNGVTAMRLNQTATPAGWRQVFIIPADATSIRLQAWSNTGLVWDSWKGIFDQTWPVPPNECIKVYGTTLDPKWNNECN